MMVQALPRRMVLEALCGMAVVTGLPRPVWAGLGPFAAVDAVIERHAREKGGRGLIAIARQHRLVHLAGIGMQPDDRFLVFSLSKMVTGLAVASLVQDRKLDFDARLEQTIGPLLKKLGPPADPR